jgi:prepilin-type N-terminal cleavage/methylation domain-containing protein
MRKYTSKIQTTWYDDAGQGHLPTHPPVICPFRGPCSKVLSHSRSPDMTRSTTDLMCTKARGVGRPGFSLIELLVVMFIIVLVISIVVPALAKAREVARATASENLMQNYFQAASAFQIDEKRAPGRFSARDMGSDDNGNTRGMTMTENVMLDLAGGIVQVGGSKPATGGVFVHPFAGTSSSRAAQEGVWVERGLIGQPTKSGKGYYTPDKRNFVEQVNEDSIIRQAGTAGDKSTDGTYPDLVDAFGQPILTWTEDESAVGKVAKDSGNSNNFARITSTQRPARHYWNSNAAFLKATHFGKKIVDNNTDSLLGGSVGIPEREATLMGLLGNPASANSIGSLTAAANIDDILPTASRGKITVQAAGVDGFILGRGDSRGRGQFKGDAMKYGFNFVDPGDTSKLRIVDGKPETVDVAASFDDQIVAGGS